MSFTAFKYHKFSALFCGFLNYPLSMSSDTISVMRHNNSCGKTLLDNWVEEVSMSLGQCFNSICSTCLETFRPNFPLNLP